MQSEHRLSSAIFPNRDVAERAAHELRRIGLANIRLSEARPSDEQPTFATFLGELARRVLPKRAEPLVDGTAPLGAFVDRLVGLGIPPETAAVVRTQLRAGATLVTVRSGDYSERAMEIMRSFHAASTPSAPTTPTTPTTPTMPTAQRPAADDAVRPAEPVAADVAPVPAPQARQTGVPGRSATPPAPPLRQPADAVAEPDRARPLSAAETAELVTGADSAMLARLQAMGGLTVRKVTTVEERRIDVELRREELVITRETGGTEASPSEIRIPLSHEELSIEKRVVLAEWQRVDFGALEGGGG